MSFIKNGKEDSLASIFVKPTTDRKFKASNSVPLIFLELNVTAKVFELIKMSLIKQICLKRAYNDLGTQLTKF